MTDPIDQNIKYMGYDPNYIDEYTFDAQDPNDPVWESSAVIAAMQQTKDYNDEYGGSPDYQEKDEGEGSGGWLEQDPLRLAGGALDFLNHIGEEVGDFFTKDDPIPAKRIVPAPIDVRDKGADKWRGRNAALSPQASAPVLENSVFRREVTIVNYGPNDAYISSLPLSQLIPAAGPVPPNCFILKPVTANVYPFMVITTKDDVWAYCAQTQAATIGIIEEFDNRR